MPGTTAVRTFLIADVRGYTEFTQRRGDEAGADLARLFSDVTRQTVESLGGDIVEVRGDECLAVFVSARQAVRAAIALQETYRRASEVNPSLAFAAGIGLDAGEAVPVEGGYRGGALNLAARLCALAAPAQILATDAVVHLARHLDNIVYQEGPPRRLKGFPEPVRVVEVRPADATPVVDQPEPKPDPDLPRGGFLGAAPAHPLVDRSEELRVAVAAVERASQGQGHCLIIAGEPGIGKTRFAQEVGMKAMAQGFRLATATCLPERQIVPFFPLVDVLGSIVASVSASARAQFTQRWPIVGRLLPSLGSPPDDGLGTGAEDRARLVRGVTEIVHTASRENPLAVLIDDLQWMDTASLEILSHLIRATRNDRVIVVATYRPVEVGQEHQVQLSLVQLEVQQLLETITLTPLGPDDTAGLVRSVFSPQDDTTDVATYVHRRSQGNPFFALELAAMVRDRGAPTLEDGAAGAPGPGDSVPERVRTVVQSRLERLSEQDRATVYMAAVLGQRFSFDDLLELAGPSEEQVEQALLSAERLGILRGDGDERYVFTHGLLQAALYGSLPARRRRRMHLQIAESIEARDAAGNRIADIAWHFAEGGDAAKAMKYLERAGDEAHRMGALTEAERLYQAALSMAWDTDGVAVGVASAATALLLLKLARAQKALGRYEGALQSAERAAQESALRGDADAERLATIESVLILTRAGRSREATERAVAALEAPHGPSAAVARLHAAEASARTASGDVVGGAAAATAAVEVATALGDVELLAEMQVVQGETLAMLGRFEEARSVFDTVMSHLPDSHAVSLIDAFHAVGALSHHAGAFDQALGYHQRALDIARRSGDRLLIVISLLNVASAHFQLGEWQRAKQMARDAVDEARATEAEWLCAYVDTLDSTIVMHQGQVDLAQDLLSRSDAVAVATHDLPLQTATERGLAELALLTGDGQTARERALRALELAGPSHRAAVLLLLARALLAVQDLDAAEARAMEAVALSTAQRSRPGFAQALWVQGTIRLRQGRPAEAVRLLRSADGLARAMPFPLLRARALQALASASHAAGDQTFAREAEREAREVYAQLGAPPMRETGGVYGGSAETAD